jgi:hypothetical protein
MDTINLFGLPITPDSRTVGPVEVIFEASDYFLLIPPQEFMKEHKVKSIRIRKTMVDGAFYLSVNK